MSLWVGDSSSNGWVRILGECVIKEGVDLEILNMCIGVVVEVCRVFCKCNVFVVEEFGGVGDYEMVEY